MNKVVFLMHLFVLHSSDTCGRPVHEHKPVTDAKMFGDPCETLTLTFMKKIDAFLPEARSSGAQG